jgi:CheY-like chemotaxis protein
MSISSVLVVDPNPATAQRVESALHGVAYQVLTARTAKAAMELVDGADVGIVLTAASLPAGSGYDLATRVRERWPAASTILVTGGFEVYSASRATEAGVAGHLAKPFSETALRGLLEEIVGPLATEPTPANEAPGPPAPVVERPVAIEPPAPVAVVPPSPPISEERLATFLPRDYQDVPLVQVDPDVVGPAVERAILEVLPEVVEAVLRHALGSSTAFRNLVSAAVDESVRETLPDIAAKVVRERLALLEARSDA